MMSIRFFVPYRDCLINQERGRIAYEFLENMEQILKVHSDCECVLMLYKNSDNIKDVLESYKCIWEEVEPSDDQFLHITKCYNQAVYTSKKEIIAPLGIDFRISDIRIVEQIKKILTALDNTLLRIKVVLMGRNDKPEKMIFNPLAIRKEMVVELGGFDERFKEWGQEDDDLTFRMRNEKPDWVELYLNYYPYIHVWHEKDFQRKSAAKYNHGPQGDIKYALIQDNLKYKSKNVVNSYATKL